MLFPKDLFATLLINRAGELIVPNCCNSRGQFFTSLLLIIMALFKKADQSQTGEQLLHSVICRDKIHLALTLVSSINQDVLIVYLFVKDDLKTCSLAASVWHYVRLRLLPDRLQWLAPFTIFVFYEILRRISDDLALLYMSNIYLFLWKISPAADILHALLTKHYSPTGVVSSICKCRSLQWSADCQRRASLEDVFQWKIT